MVSTAKLIMIACWAIWQSLIYMLLSICAIMVFHCDMSMDNTEFNYLLYIAYFRNAACGPVNWGNLGLDTPYVEPILKTISPNVIRTNDFAYAYLVLSCMWMMASLLLIIGVTSSWILRAVFSIMWMVVCWSVLTMDAVASIMFMIDITSTMTTSGFLDFIGVLNKEDVMNFAEKIPDFFLPIPSILMTLVASRGVIFFFANLSCLVFVTLAVRKQLRSREEIEMREIDNPEEPDNPEKPGEPEKSDKPEKPAKRQKRQKPDKSEKIEPNAEV